MTNNTQASQQVPVAMTLREKVKREILGRRAGRAMGSEIWCEIGKIANQIDDLLAQSTTAVTEDAQDAERYRFARDNIREDHALPGGFYLTDKGAKKSWDKTIDAACAFTNGNSYE